MWYNFYGDNMDSNQKNFNLYVFFSTFARNLVELYIPILFYKAGYDLPSIMIYFLLIHFISLLLDYPCIYLSKKLDNRVLSIVGIIAFCLLQILLNIKMTGIFSIILIACVYSLYRRGYWIARRYYNLKVIHKDDISKSYSIISIINQIGVIVSSYIGALFLDYFSLKILTIISIVLFLFSVIYLYKLKFTHEKNDIKIDLFKTLKKIPKEDIFLFGTYELTTVVKLIFPLFLFLYVKDNFQTVGLLTLFTNLATILFAYFYGKKVNGKKNFLTLSLVLVVLVFFMKCNVTGILLVIVSFFEGIVGKMHEISMSKEFYALSKKFEYYNYNLAYEVIQNVSRTVMTLILLIFIKDLKMMIYVTLLVMLTGIFVKFKKARGRDFDI